MSTDQRLRWPTKRWRRAEARRRISLVPETKTKLHLFLGARRGRHPLGQFNSPIVPEAVDGKPRGRGPPRPGGEVRTATAAPVSTKSTARLPHCEHTSRRCHSGIGVSAPCRRAAPPGPARPGVGNHGTRRLFAPGPCIVALSHLTRRWRETDSNSRSPVGGDTPQRPQITSLPIIFP